MGRRITLRTGTEMGMADHDGGHKARCTSALSLSRAVQKPHKGFEFVSLLFLLGAIFFKEWTRNFASVMALFNYFIRIKPLLKMAYIEKELQIYTY